MCSLKPNAQQQHCPTCRPRVFSTAGKFDTLQFSLAGILGFEQNQETWPHAPCSQQDEYPKEKSGQKRLLSVE
jgi:hypothetical protein